MASSVVACRDARIGASFTKKRKGSGLSGFSALVGGGVLASVCAITAFASLHGMAQASHGAQRFDTMLVSNMDRLERASIDAAERNVHIRKFSRLSESGHLGNQKGTRLAAEHHIGAKAFADRFGGAAAINAQGQATVQALAALRPSAIVDSALGRTTDNPELAMLETQAKEHPAFEVALGKPQTTTDDEIDLLPETVPLPSFRPQIAKADVEPTPRPANPAAAEKQLAVATPAPARPAAPQAPATNTMVAFARPDNPMRETKMDAVPWPDRGNGTAIYDISAGVVHMPSGEKLEAHSGIGKMRDNPDFVHVKMRGATPPSAYKLTMRESLFHGVEAIRLTPESGIKPHGRDGLLAHTYMLARRGESNGCVVFKDYSKFLAAFKRGEVKRIVVVPKLSGRPAMTASGSKSGGKTLFGMLAGTDS